MLSLFVKLKNVVPLTLEFSEYAEATLAILGEEACITPIKLLKYKTVVYLVYSMGFYCLFGVFRIYNILPIEVE